MDLISLQAMTDNIENIITAEKKVYCSEMEKSGHDKYSL